MSLGTDIAPHLPFLRRFGRSLLGSQAAGDAIVRRTLESIVEHPDHFPRDVDRRLGLYRMFLQELDSSQLDDLADSVEAPRTEGEQVSSRRMQFMSRDQRRALLLTAMEGFSPDDAGYLIQQSPAEIDRLVSDALQEIERQTRSSILIIEDEPILAMDLESIVTDLGHRVTGVAVTRAEAVALAKSDPPGLVLADIGLADDSSGIDAVRDILAIRPAAVIFVTAFPERLLIGERPEPTFLITKPYQRSTVKAAISQALFFDETTIPEASESEQLREEVSSDDVSTSRELAKAAAELAAVDVTPLPGPVQAEVIDGQLRRAKGLKPRPLTGDRGTEALRRLHHITATRLSKSLAGTNLGLAFSVRLAAIELALSDTLDQAGGLAVGVQVRGLRRMLPAIHEQLNEHDAADIAAFLDDVADLAWMFPEYRAFAAEAERTARADDISRSALNEVSRVLESQPDDLVTADMKDALAAERVNAAESNDPIAELGQRRTIANVMRAYASFLKDRRTGVLDNTWKSFDKASGGMIGASLAVLFIIAPLLYGISIAFPGEFAAVVALAKTVKMMIP